MSAEAIDGSRRSGEDDGRRFPPVRNRDFWEGRASEFSEYASSTGYAEGFLKVMGEDIRKDWTVLDMGCGGGTLTVPLARRVKGVTAVDFSKNMLDILTRRCAEQGITNVTAIRGRWEDDWSSLGIVKSDVAIASRSIIGDDPLPLLMKLDHAATRRVYVSANVGDGPFDRRAYEATGRTLQARSDYKPIYDHLLGQEMGVRAKIAFVPEDHAGEWGSLEEAVDGQRWMFTGLTADEEENLRIYLDSCLVRVGGRLRLPYERRCEWAVMWWEKL